MTATYIKLWLGAYKGILPVKYFCPTKPLFVSVKFHGDHMTVKKAEGNLATLGFGGIYRI